MVTSARGPSAARRRPLRARPRGASAPSSPASSCASRSVSWTSARRARCAAPASTIVNHNLNTSRRYYPAICTHAHLRRPRGDGARTRARAGHVGVLGRHRRHGGDRRRSGRRCAGARRAAGRVAAGQLPASRSTARRSAGAIRRRRRRCLRALALFRLTNPRAEIRAAGGRERCLGDAQGLALFAANSVFVDGYLTTAGAGAPRGRRHGRSARAFEVEAPTAVIEDAAAL